MNNKETVLKTSVDELFQNLVAKYKIVCFVDLAELSVSHGAVFKFLKLLHKDRYEDHERLVFYSSHPVSQDFLNHLQRAVIKIDISNFFVLICHPEDLTHKLERANQLYGNDNSVITNLIVDLESTTPLCDTRFYSRDTFCPLPFSQLFVSTTGNVSPCCKYKGVVGNLSSSTLNEIFLGHELNELRLQMLRKERPIGCQTCWHTEQSGVTSFRQHALNKYGNACDHDWIDSVKIRDLTISPNNLCNFKCRICYPGASSKVASEELQYASDETTRAELKRIIRLSTKNQIDQLQLSLPAISKDLEHLHVMGGEPFLIPGIENLLTQIVDQQHSDHIQLEFNSNGSVWPSKLFPLFEKFKKVEILLSIDNIGEKFEVERGGSWVEVFENIKNFVKLQSSKIDVKLSVTVNVQNLLYLEDVVNLAQQLGIEIVWWYLESPSYMCIDNVNHTVKKLVYQKYHDHTVPELAKISNRVQNTPEADTQLFVKHMDVLDQRRQQQFSQTHEEIYKAMSQQC